jgi:hypothetical protein
MEREKARGGSAAVWVLVVLLVGVATGLLLSVFPAPATGTSPGRGFGWHLQFTSASDFDVVLSTVGIVLIVALLVVYLRTYSQTRANFALGLVVVLLALLMESILSSPLLYGAFGETSDGLGTFLAFADGFKVVAFTAFLYLSLA